ncbi:hypothetical protein OSB04_021609 [Centaurea solstitialis]|uniref:protein-disulfide reductase n=1 Tax=Centaurea solstitialis TaxID=347529 RepID=A0AA38WHX2_9ASTR|nr:hypothetical protein OSB04_021609 [Centaurea solstitialis]
MLPLGICSPFGDMEFLPVLGLAEGKIVQEALDDDVESFNDYFSKMPWLAISFTDTKTRDALNRHFKLNGIRHLVFLNENGKVLKDGRAMLIREHGAEGYQFTPERLKEIKEQEDEARKNQSLRSILESPSRNFLITTNGNKVKLFNEELNDVPWFSLPFKDKRRGKLIQYFKISSIPTLIIIRPDGKILNPNAVDAIEENGKYTYPFTLDRLSQLQNIEKARQEAQTLESVLVSRDLDFVVGKDGMKIPVSNLIGEYTLLYFNANWCPPCCLFNKQLLKAYHEMKAKHNKFEVIYISYAKDQASYDNHYSTMPWQALPFHDKRKQSLSHLFKVKGIPVLVALDPTGKTYDHNKC